MGDFFSIDGKFYQFGSLILDILTAGFLWTIFSLPIITIGASTTALYYVYTKKHSGQDIYVFKSFWQSFKENFVKSTIVLIILSIIALFLWTSIHIQGQLATNWFAWPVRFALYFMLFQVALVGTTVFAILSRFEMTIKAALRYGLYMAYRNFFTTIVNWFILAAILIASIFFPMLLIFTGGIYIYISAHFFVKVFRKHSEEFDNQVEAKDNIK